MTTTTFLTAYLVAVGIAVGRATLLYAVGMGLVAGAASPAARWTGVFTRGRVAVGADRVRAGGAFGVARSYLIPGVSEATQVMAGMSRMPMRSFAGGFLLAALPWAVVDATVGSALWAAAMSGWGLAVVVAVLALVGWRHRGSIQRRFRSGDPEPVSMPA